MAGARRTGASSLLIALLHTQPPTEQSGTQQQMRPRTGKMMDARTPQGVHVHSQRPHGVTPGNPRPLAPLQTGSKQQPPALASEAPLPCDCQKRRMGVSEKVWTRSPTRPKRIRGRGAPEAARLTMFVRAVGTNSGVGGVS